MPRTILITGANRGIGFSIVQGLAVRKSSDQLILAARFVDKANGAIAELRKLGITAEIDSLALDVMDDVSIKAAEQTVRERYGKLDILINNAGIGLVPSPGEIDNLRSIYNAVYDTNVSGVAVVTSVFLPLLALSPDPRVINVSSARASIELAMSGELPPTRSIPYSASKTALNVLTIEYQKLHPNTIDPGYCKTGLNGYEGLRDPLDGAGVVVELANAARDKYKSGFWAMENDAEECSTVPW
ncbi:Short-chain dehydrogenase/reductase tropE [Sparassis crispa]|uniref:Short-chain dehydrogenase/reductase tropE n=1 Tax=Sparassis crispa TaxID=139825 RepID=A0A401GL06_9APHY|nr:Short-chain dehydrogenase/reductase tropE [Sparassis crispa]GBE82855.1 Short-chain dehydrogenase/reductase tropE [Sparassis crispa]